MASSAEKGVSLWDRSILWVAVAALVATPLICIDSLGDMTNLPKALFVQNAAVGLFILWMGSGKSLGRLEFPSSSLSTFLFILLGWGFISIFWATNEVLAFRQWMIWLSCWVFFMVLSARLSKMSQIRKLVFGAFAAGVMVAGLGLLQYFWGVDWIRQFVPPAATFGNKNMAAEFTVLAFPVAIGLFLLSRRNVAIALYSAGIVLLASFIFHSFTKASWLAATVELLLLAVFAVCKGREFWRRFNRQKTIAAALILLCLLGVSQLSREGLKPRTDDAVTAVSSIFSPPQQAGPSSSLAVRIRYWKNAGALIADHFYKGVGLGNWRVVYPKYKMAVVDQYLKGHATYYAHNDFIHLMAEGGLVGVLLLLMVVGAAAYFAFRAQRRAGTMEQWLMVVSVSVGLVGIAVNGLFSFPLQLPAAVLYSAVYLSVLHVLGASALNHEKPASRAGLRSFAWPSAAGWAGVAIGIVLMGASLFHSYSRVSADYFSYKMMADIVHKDWKRAVFHGEQSLQRDPEHWKSRFLMGQALFNRGRFAEALDSYSSFLNRYPNDYGALNNLGLVFQKLGNTESAKQSYRQVLKMNPRHGTALVRLGMIHGLQGDHAAAFELFTRAAAAEPNNANFQYNLAVSAVHLEKSSLAENALKRAVELRPDYSQAMLKLGLLYASQKNYNDAARMFKRVLHIDPDQAHARKYLTELERAGIAQ